MVSLEDGDPSCSLDCHPSNSSLSLKVLAHGIKNLLGRESSSPCYLCVMAVPGFSQYIKIYKQNATGLKIQTNS